MVVVWFVDELFIIIHRHEQSRIDKFGTRAGYIVLINPINCLCWWVIILISGSFCSKGGFGVIIVGTLRIVPAFTIVM